MMTKEQVTQFKSDLWSAAAATWLCGTTPPAQFYPPSYHQDLMKVLTSANPATAGESMRENVQFTKNGALVHLEVFFRAEKDRKARKASLASWLMPEREPIAASALAAEMRNVNGDGQVSASRLHRHLFTPALDCASGGRKFVGKQARSDLKKATCGFCRAMASACLGNGGFGLRWLLAKMVGKA
jgi:hypothetical protein